MINNTQTILLLRLTSGEEIIAKVRDDNTGNLELEKPYVFITQEDSTGNVSGGFVPFMPLAENSIVMLVQRPTAMATPNKNASDSYLRLIGDKVVQTESKSIIIPK